MCKKWIKLKLRSERKGSGRSMRIPNDEVFALRLILNVTLVMRRPRRPSHPGWVPPIALSSCSGEWIKRVSLTGLTSSLLLHQSEGSKVRSIGSPWPTVCNWAYSPVNWKWDCYSERFPAEIGASVYKWLTYKWSSDELSCQIKANLFRSDFAEQRYGVYRLKRPYCSDENHEVFPYIYGIRS